MQQPPSQSMSAQLGERNVLLSALKNARFAAFVEAAGAAAANFLVSIFVARTYDVTTFSGYVTSLSAVFVVIAFLRFSFTIPSAVKPDAWYEKRLRALAAVHVVAIIISVTMISLLMIALALILQKPLWTTAAMTAPGISLWFLGNEFERSFLVKQGQFNRLLAISIIQGLALLLVLLVVWYFNLPILSLIAAMAAIGMAKTGAALAVAGSPNWRRGFHQMKLGLQKLGLGSVAYLLGGAACSHAPVFALSLMSAPEQAAAFGAMRTLYQPAQIFFRSRDVVVQSRFHEDNVAIAETISAQHLKRMGSTALLSTIIGGAFLIAGPWLVPWIYAARFNDDMTTFWLWAVIMLMINLAAITDAFISYLKLHGRFAPAQISAGLVATGLSALLVPPFGAEGAAIAATSGWLVIVLGGSLLIKKHADKGRV